MQTTFVPAGATRESLETPGAVRGNCLQAAVASLFELSLSEVPHFVAEDDWWGCLADWLDVRGLTPVYVPHSDVMPWGVPYLAIGDSPRGDYSHVVIEVENELVHDPHPDGTGLRDFRKGIYLFVPKSYA